MKNHYYLLPDGTRAENMKEACEMMHIRTGLFKRLVKSGDIIKKEDVAESNRYASNTNAQNGVINEVRTKQAKR